MSNLNNLVGAFRKVVSPFPWHVSTDNEIVDSNGCNIVCTDSGFYPPCVDDANVMAAAPELLISVAKLYDLVEKYVSFPKNCVALENDKTLALIEAARAIYKALGYDEN